MPLQLLPDRPLPAHLPRMPTKSQSFRRSGRPRKSSLPKRRNPWTLLQRELAFEQDNVYSKPDYASNTAGLAKLEDLKQQLTDKQQAVDALKTRLDALLDSIGAAPAPPAVPPAILRSPDPQSSGLAAGRIFLSSFIFLFHYFVNFLPRLLRILSSTRGQFSPRDGFPCN